MGAASAFARWPQILLFSIKVADVGDSVRWHVGMRDVAAFCSRSECKCRNRSHLRHWKFGDAANFPRPTVRSRKNGLIPN